MGNSSGSYMPLKEAEELLGEPGKVLRVQLERQHRRSLDVSVLARLLADKCCPPPPRPSHRV